MPPPINPILQGPPNPLEGLIPQLAQIPDTPTGGGGVFADLFGAGQGQGLPTDQRSQLGQSALGAAGQSLLESSGPGPNGFTPGTLQAIGRALGAGQDQFAENVAAAEAASRRKKIADTLANADDDLESRIEAMRTVRDQFISEDRVEAANGVEDMIQNLSPDEKFTTTSLGGGLGVITNNSTGDWREIGTRDPLRGAGGSGTNKAHQVTAVNPATDRLELAYWTDADPGKFIFASGVEPAVVEEKDVTAAQGTALFQGSNVTAALADLQQFYGVDLTQPLEGQELQDNPSFIAQWLISNDPTGWGRGLTSDEQQLFSQGQAKGLEAIARLATGAAINAGEERRFKRMLPQVGDSRATVLNKLVFLQDLQAVLQVMAGSGITDQEQARAILKDKGIIQRANTNIDQRAARRVFDSTDPDARLPGTSGNAFDIVPD